jgi:murein endopeptidase
MKGPKYLLCGSRLTSDTCIRRVILEGLNTQARVWSETITIQDDGSLQGLEHEVEQFRHLKYVRTRTWSDPNVVIAFIDRLSMKRATQRTLDYAIQEGRPVFIVSDYIKDGSGNFLP